MFSKYIEWLVLAQFRNKINKITTNSLFSVVATVFGFLCLLLVMYTLNSILLRSFLFALSFIFITYWFFSIFIYLFKKAQYGTYTRIIQRFWKRTLWLFWLIELFLFCIYLFLAIISPQEVSYMLDTIQLVNNNATNFNNFFANTQYALLIVLLANILILTHKYNTINGIVMCTLTFLLLRAVYEDFIQFITINNYYGGFNWVRLKTDFSANTVSDFLAAGIWEQEVIEFKNRTIMHYVYLLIFLKLWHTVFIFLFFIFFENIRLYTNNTSFNLLAANLQNFYFLLFFNYILKFFTIKLFLNYLGSFVYFWFILNANTYDMVALYYLFQWEYLLLFNL